MTVTNMKCIRLMIRNSSYSFVRILFILALIQTFERRSATAQTATTPFEQIRKAILDRQKSIKSVRVTYDLTAEKLADNPNQRHWSSRIWDTTRITFVIDNDRRYLRQKSSRKTSPETVVSFDGRDTLTLFNGAAIVDEGKLQQCEDGEVYCNRFLQLPYRDEDKVNRPSQWFLSCALDLHKEAYRHRAKQEQIDGAWCDVVEVPNHDLIWVDAQLGYAARKRELYTGNPSKGVVHKSCELRMANFVAGAPGIWVPRTATLTNFAVLRAGGPDTATDTQTINVLEVALNQVQEKDFEVKLLPGTAVAKGDEVFVVRGDAGLLLNEFANVHAPPKPALAPNPRSRALLILTSLLFLLMGVFAFRVIVRRRLRRGA